MNRYIIIKMDSTLYEQAKTGTLKVGDILKKRNLTRIVSEIYKLDNETYRISFTNKEGINVSSIINDEWEKVEQVGGKKKRKSRRNKKTKRRKSQRHR